MIWLWEQAFMINKWTNDFDPYNKLKKYWSGIIKLVNIKTFHSKIFEHFPYQSGWVALGRFFVLENKIFDEYFWRSWKVRLKFVQHNWGASLVYQPIDKRFRATNQSNKKSDLFWESFIQTWEIIKAIRRIFQDYAQFLKTPPWIQSFLLDFTPKTTRWNDFQRKSINTNE